MEYSYDILWRGASASKVVRASLTCITHTFTDEVFLLREGQEVKGVLYSYRSAFDFVELS